jgi:carboxyl-terminal processing protease
MPDYFVPLDTTLNSHYLNELYTSIAIHEYTFQYVEKYRDELLKMGRENFLKSFKVTDNMIEGLVNVGIKNKVKPDQKILNARKELFRIHLKAQIARKLWGNEGFYPVFNETNEVFLQSIKIFDRIPELKRSDM